MEGCRTAQREPRKPWPLGAADRRARHKSWVPKGPPTLQGAWRWGAARNQNREGGPFLPHCFQRPCWHSREWCQEAKDKMFKGPCSSFTRWAIGGTLGTQGPSVGTWPTPRPWLLHWPLLRLARSSNPAPHFHPARSGLASHTCRSCRPRPSRGHRVPAPPHREDSRCGRHSGPADSGRPR